LAVFHIYEMQDTPMSLNDVLTDTRITDAKPDAKPLRLFDGGGLYLEVSPAGGKLWRLKYRFEGKEKRLALGKYPEVGLKEARKQRTLARKLLLLGIDPGIAHKEERAEVSAAQRDARVKARDEEARRKGAARFLLDNEGALSFRLGNRSLFLTPAETAELRAFLNATQGVIHAAD
jgi:hypothetical protein